MIIHVLCRTDMDIRNLGRISCSLDAILNTIIGREVLINVRRTTTNLRDDLFRREHELLNSKYLPVYSGSKAEGLRFKSSDEDWMLIYRNIKVIPSESFMAIYDSNTTLLLMENKMTKPGFTLLNLIGESSKPAVRRSMNGHYVSCKLWRELHTKQSEFTHGPCASAIIGPLEYDYAFCLRCDIWPTNAQDCIRRLHQCGWPSHGTVLSIVNDGVLFVPIGAKQSVFENMEWRMSFSLAEKKLIHAMNHTQFLCYGLLKIFLKEAIDVNPDVKGLLCSYFLKTALFWEITTTSNQWSPSTLLSGFWNCFCRLLQWVSCSYCPNFFIPQNNMFGGKIEGGNRDKLLQHLRILYLEGYKCLLRCQSLADKMSLTMHRNVKLVFWEKDKGIMIALEVITEFLNYRICFQLLKKLWMYQFVSPTCSHERFLLRHWLYQDLTYLSMLGYIYNSATSPGNKSQFCNLTKRMNIVRRCLTDSAAYLLYQAMLCYNNERYNRALRLVQQSKEKISDPSTIYWYKRTDKQCREAGFDRLPIEFMLKRHILDIITIENYQYIPELYLELHSRDAVSIPFLISIPPLVCGFFLQYLCLRKLGLLREADKALYELSLLVKHDDEHHISINHRAVSWNIIAICQQMRGDDRAACRSFYRAQQCLGRDMFKVATSIRLGIILLKYL